MPSWAVVAGFRTPEKKTSLVAPLLWGLPYLVLELLFPLAVLLTSSRSDFALASDIITIIGFCLYATIWPIAASKYKMTAMCWWVIYANAMLMFYALAEWSICRWPYFNDQLYLQAQAKIACTNFFGNSFYYIIVISLIISGAAWLTYKNFCRGLFTRRVYSLQPNSVYFAYKMPIGLSLSRVPLWQKLLIFFGSVWNAVFVGKSTVVVDKGGEAMHYKFVSMTGGSFPKDKALCAVPVKSDLFDKWVVVKIAEKPSSAHNKLSKYLGYSGALVKKWRIERPCEHVTRELS